MNYFGVLNNPVVNEKFQSSLNQCYKPKIYENVAKDLNELSHVSRQEGLIPMCEIHCANGILQEILTFTGGLLKHTEVPLIYDKLMFVFAPVLLNDSLSERDYVLTVLYCEAMSQILAGEPAELVLLRTKKIMGV